MIRLTVPIKGCEDLQAPFVVRLRENGSGGAVGPGDGAFHVDHDGQVSVTCAEGEFAFKARDEEPDFDGDVLAVYPHRRHALRLIRRRSNSNTLLLTEECDQLCVMCSQPPKAKRHDDFALYRRAVELAPKDAVIGISGGEPTLLKDALFSWLREMIELRPDVTYHILSNAQHFEIKDAQCVKAIRHHVLWGIPLYAPEAGLHDQIVGKQGAFERLLPSLDILASNGVSVELRTVIMQQNIQGLPRLARFVATHLGWVTQWALMQLECRGYARLNWQNIFVDTSSGFAPIATACRITGSAKVPVHLFNFPLCAVPTEYRHLAAASISDWKQKYLPTCEGCSQTGRCGGFFEWHPDDHSYQKVGPI